DFSEVTSPQLAHTGRRWSETARRKHRSFDVPPTALRKIRNPRTNSRLPYKCEVVEIERTCRRHAVINRQDHFRSEPPNVPRCRNHDELTERADHGIASKEQDRAPLVGCGERVPADFTAAH